MKKNVLIVGAGAVAHVAAHKCAQNNDILGDICIASRKKEKCDKIIESVQRKGSLKDKAKKLYLDVLQQTDNQTMHSAAYYGMARIAALQKNPDLAERLFVKTLELAPEPQVKAWALVYLGRLSLAANDRDKAAEYFRSALKVEGASQAAQQAASQGVEQSSKQ